MYMIIERTAFQAFEQVREIYRNRSLNKNLSNEHLLLFVFINILLGMSVSDSEFAHAFRC